MTACEFQPVTFHLFYVSAALGPNKKWKINSTNLLCFQLWVKRSLAILFCVEKTVSRALWHRVQLSCYNFLFGHKIRTSNAIFHLFDNNNTVTKRVNLDPVSALNQI